MCGVNVVYFRLNAIVTVDLISHWIVRLSFGFPLCVWCSNVFCVGRMENVFFLLCSTVLHSCSLWFMKYCSSGFSLRKLSVSFVLMSTWGRWHTHHIELSHSPVSAVTVCTPHDNVVSFVHVLSSCVLFCFRFFRFLVLCLITCLFFALSVSRCVCSTAVIGR